MDMFGGSGEIEKRLRVAYRHSLSVDAIYKQRGVVNTGKI
jgi:hypothetical protein